MKNIKTRAQPEAMSFKVESRIPGFNTLSSHTAAAWTVYEGEPDQAWNLGVPFPCFPEQK